MEFPDEQVERLRALAATVPTVLDVYLDRPAMVRPFVEMAGLTLIANYSSSDEALARVLFGEVEPLGRLPFQVSSSMAEVEASRPDVPSDTPNPTFEFGDGLRGFSDARLRAPCAAPRAGRARGVRGVMSDRRARPR